MGLHAGLSPAPCADADQPTPQPPVSGKGTAGGGTAAAGSATMPRGSAGASGGVGRRRVGLTHQPGSAAAMALAADSAYRAVA